MRKETGNSKSKTAYFLSGVFALVLAAYSLTGCPDASSGSTTPSAPAAGNAEVQKTSPVQKSAAFTLTGSYSSAGTWAVYRASSSSAMKTVSAAFNAPTLTLTAAGYDLAAGVYYVTVTEPGSGESARLALTVKEYVSSGAASIAVKPEATPMLHRGGLNTPEDFERVRSRINAGREPWVSGWNKLCANSHAQLGYTPPDPTVKIIRGGNTIEEPEADNAGIASVNAAAAYNLALRWKISQDNTYAEKAVEILNAWADTCTAVTGDSNRTLAAGFSGYQFAVAGELLRDFEGWDAADFAAYQQWMLDVFYTQNKDFLDRHHDTYDDHYWANWDLASLASAIAIGILADRRDIYNYAVNYLQNGAGNGRLTKAINNLHTVDGEELGQIQEAGRDQGHCTLVISLIGVICQLTWNQGDDFYGYDNNRFLKGCEYVAKYNVANLDVPFTEYTRTWGNKQYSAQTETHTVVSAEGRGTVRPMWALPYYHYANIKGVDPAKVRYTKLGMESVAPEGGGGDYGSGGGLDQLGFGGLLYGR